MLFCFLIKLNPSFCLLIFNILHKTPRIISLYLGCSFNLHTVLVFHNVTKGCSEVNGSLFYQVTSNRTRNGLKLSEGKLRLDNRKNLFTEGVFKHWKRFPSKVVVSPSLEVFKSCAEGALRHRIYWQPWQFWVHGWT